MSLIENVQSAVPDTQCKGCYKYYVSDTGLLQHIQRSPMCGKWISILQEDNNFSKDIQEKYSITPSPIESTLIHIIWNVFLTDKTQIKNIDKEINMNNIKYMICILPDKNIYESIKPKNEIDHCIIEYEDHNSIVTNSVSMKYEEYFDKIEYFQGNRQNTIIFCNSGYQRSLPFICKYLTSRHKDEVPDIDKALDIVLSQVDKANYLSTKPFIKENLLMLKKEDMTNFFNDVHIKT